MIYLAMVWLCILLFKLVFASRVIRQSKSQSSLLWQKSVTIIQPILSGDPKLAEVLEANVIALNEARFLWLIDDNDPVASELTRLLQQRYASRKIDVRSYPDAPDEVNPKLFKLEQAWRSVESEVCLVLDDDAILSPAALAALLNQVTEAALATALPYYRADKNWPSRLLAQFVNDNSGFTYLPLLPFAPPLTLNGMCYALSVKTLTRLGGFSRIMRYLTDDLALATLLQQHNIRVIQSTAPVMVQTSLPNGRKYLQQMHRWFLFATLLIRDKTTFEKLAIFLLQGLHPLLLWAMLIIAVMTLFSPQPMTENNLLIAVVCLVVRQIAIRKIQRDMALDICTHPFLSLCSELMQPLHLLHALCNRTIYWRTRRYRVFSNDKFTSL